MYICKKNNVMIEKTDYQFQIIQNVRKIRLEHDVTQSGLGDILGLSKGQIGNIESTKYPQKYTLKQLYHICCHFEVSLQSILFTEEEQNTKNEIELLIKKIIEYEQ